MMKFYSVELESKLIGPYFFKNLNNAREFLWDYWLDSKGRTCSPEENDSYKYFLDHCDSIPGFGCIYEDTFEDEYDD